MKKSIVVLTALTLATLSASVAQAYDSLSEQEFPLSIVVENNTPQDFHIPQVKAFLPSSINDVNFETVIFQTPDDMRRFLSDLMQLLSLNPYENAMALYLESDFNAQPVLQDGEDKTDTSSIGDPGLQFNQGTEGLIDTSSTPKAESETGASSVESQVAASDTSLAAGAGSSDQQNANSGSGAASDASANEGAGSVDSKISNPDGDIAAGTKKAAATKSAKK